MGVMADLPGTDPVATLLAKHLPTHLRPQHRDLSGAWPAARPPATTRDDPFTPDVDAEPEPTDDDYGVAEATRTNAWRKIATLARAQIAATSPHSSRGDDGAESPRNDGLEIVLHWWSVRLYALARLHLFSMFSSESAALWDVLTTTLRDQNAVPFTLRVLKAIEPHYSRRDTVGALEQMAQLIAYSRAQLRHARDGDAQQLWRKRVLQLTLDQGILLCRAKDYAHAVHVLQPMATHLAGSAADTGGVLDRAARVFILLFLARVWIQAASLGSAQHLIDAAASHLTKVVTPTDKAILHNELAISRGVLSTLRCDFDSASEQFARVEGGGSDGEGRKQDVQAQSNLALSTFYAGELSPAIDHLERMLARHPDTAVNAEPFLFNLTTLLELRSEDVLADKRRILAILGQHATHSSGVLTASGLKL